MSARADTGLDAWSRRRAAVRAEEEDRLRAEAATRKAAREAELEVLPEDELLAELGLPVPEDLSAGDDFSAFMKSTVPTVLRNRALRQLWASNPVLANVDGLVDYGEDFAAEGSSGLLVKTLYRVGKGLVSDDAEPEKVAMADAPVSSKAPGTEPDDAALAEQPKPAPEAQEAADAPEQHVAPRHARPRMQFEFDDKEQNTG